MNRQYNGPVIGAGDSIGQFQLIREVGRGGMGVVYLAHDTRLNRDVAIKCLPDDFATDTERLERFRREARLLASLNHPNIATIHGLEEVDGKTYLVLEHVDGRTFRDFIDRDDRSHAQSVETAARIAEAIAAAHARGIVHRDIKPDNIRFMDDGTVKVLDFGLASEIPPEGDGEADGTAVTLKTGAGAVMGTPGYMSPEQARGERADKLSDIFALGCLVYEMLTGRRAFQGGSAADSIAATLREEVTPPSQTSSEIPPELDAIVMRCLERRAEDRFQSAQDLAFSLRSALGTSRSALTSERPARINSRSRMRWLVISVLALSISALAVWRFLPRPADAAVIQSLAVLPFANGSSDLDAGFLCDGIAESIANRLANLSDLRVVPSHSSFHYRGESVDLDQVARELDAHAILTGRLLRRGDRITVSVSLIDARADRHVWGDRFEEPLGNVLVLESEIADRVASQLRLQLIGEERSQLAKSATTVPEAHLAYLRGRHFWWTSNSQDDLWTAAQHFEQAIELDPDYALPYCGLVDAKCILAAWGAVQPLETRGELQARVDTALALDESLAEAHVSAGTVAMYLSWDWAAAESAFRRAIALDPGLANGYLEYGRMLAWVGRLDESEAIYRKGIEANPVAPTFLTGLGMLYAGSDRLEEAEEVLNEALLVSPDHHEALIWLGVVRQHQGRFDEAVELAEQVVLTREKPEFALSAFLVNAYAMAGRTDEAREVLSRMQESKDDTPAHHLWLAESHAALGEVDRAFAELDLAMEAREAWLPNLRFDPGLVPLRRDPRFAEIHRRMGLGHVDLSLPPQH